MAAERGVRIAEEELGAIPFSIQTLGKPLRRNNLAIITASRHKGPQQNTLNCTSYFGAAPKRALGGS